MEKSWLIQRLKVPFDTNNKLSKLLNVFSFGGGLVNGGLSKDAMKLLSPIFSFDYMGAAEYEWGIIPKTLEKVAKNIKNYIAEKVEVSYKYQSYFSLLEEKQSLKLGKSNLKAGKSTVYIICFKEDFNEIKDKISNWAIGKGETRDHIGIDESLAIPEKTKIKGWLELDNGFLFFTNKEMFEKTCHLFNTKTDNIRL